MDSRSSRSDRVIARAEGKSAGGGGGERVPSASRAELATIEHVGDGAAENALIFGDNLAALEVLARTHTGQIRCAYLDPPFNTGRTFAEYTDRRASEDWADMMRPRLEALAPLLADDGAVFAEIDDTELARLVGLLDDVFGAKNRVSTITVVRSAATGHKAKNAAPVHVSDFLLVYAKNKKAWRYRPQFHLREGLDPAYGTWLDNPDEPPRTWTFRPLRAAFARHLGHGTSRQSRQALGASEYDRALENFALTNARHVVRFAQPRYEAIGREAQRVVDASRADKETVYVLPREGRPPFIVRGGNRILFFADKVRTIAGEARVVEPLTNVWSDVPFQGIAREGGVVFARNKKPEKLLARVVAMATDPGDWVLDPFLGSGTTAAVAHKMGRRWIGVEAGEHLRTLALPRLTRVVRGEDRTGVSAELGFTGGGGFRVDRVR